MNLLPSASTPEIYLENNPQSPNFNKWCINWRDGYTLDGYETRAQALADLWLKRTNQDIRKGKA
jgi:hypothetical protein